MHKMIKLPRRKSKRAATRQDHQRDEVVATVWLVFYVLAIVVALSSPFITHAFEIASK
jgi:hypothetical protein